MLIITCIHILFLTLIIYKEILKIKYIFAMKTVFVTCKAMNID
jgi:hypothetical protein